MSPNPLDPALLLAGGSMGVAIIAVVVAVLQWRGTKRRRIRVTQQTFALTQVASPKLLRIMLTNGVELNEPWSVRVVLNAERTRDVEIAAFNNLPIKINTAVPVVSLLAISGRADGPALIGAWNAASEKISEVHQYPTLIELPPYLLSGRRPWAIQMVCEGEPEITVAGDLTNVDWSYASRPSAQLVRFALLAYGASLIGLFGFGYILLKIGEMIGVGWTIAIVPLIATGIAVALRSSIRRFRWRDR